MIRAHRPLRVAALILLTISAVACDIGSSLEPAIPETSTKPPRTVKPKVLTRTDARTPDNLR